MLISLQVARAFLQPGCFDDGNYRCLIRSTSELAGAGGMAAKVWSKSEGLGPVGEAEAGTEGAEGAVAGNEGEAGGEGGGGDRVKRGSLRELRQSRRERKGRPRSRACEKE